MLFGRDRQVAAPGPSLPSSTASCFTLCCFDVINIWYDGCARGCELALNASGGRHRLGIIVYAARDSNQVGGGHAGSSSSVSSDGGNTSTPLAVLQLTDSGSRRRLATWQRLLLPTTYVQDALDSGDGVVRLRIVCDGCSAFGRRLLGEPAAPTARVDAAAANDDGGDGPYLEVVARRSRRRRRRHRHRLCPAPTDDAAGTGRLAAIMRRRCWSSTLNIL